jgi:phage terminase large subunit
MCAYPDDKGEALFVCAREYQSTIRDSVHRVVRQQIYLMGLTEYFDVGQTTITCLLTKAQFIFKGIRRDPDGFRSLEGGRYFWLEEAHNISQESWEIIIPTARRPGSEIWCSFNPHDEADPTYKMFVAKRQEHAMWDLLSDEEKEYTPRAIIREVNWRDNPHFPKELETARRYMLRTDPEAYDHVWEGKVKRLTEACIFKNKYEVCTFETPAWVRFRFGADFGFAVSPNTLIRCWLGPPIDELSSEPSRSQSCLYVDQEAYAVGVDLHHMKEFYERVDGCHKWPIKADGARPETISYLGSEGGFNISAAEKWPGSVEDGIAHLRAFEKIYIHEDCKWTAQEFRLYSYKVDEKTDLVLPKIVDEHNHCIDSLRYALDGFIQRRGGLGTWRKLANRGIRR